MRGLLGLTWPTQPMICLGLRHGILCRPLDLETWRLENDKKHTLHCIGHWRGHLHWSLVIGCLVRCSWLLGRDWQGR